MIFQKNPSFNAINPSTPDSLKPWFGSQGGVAKQVSNFANGCSNCFVPDESLFVIWAFPNDVFSNAVFGLTPTALITTGATNITTAIQLLMGEGATHFLVPNMPDLGNTPGFLGNTDLTDLTLAFNVALAGALTALDQAMSQVAITQFDTFGTLSDVITKQVKYGMSHVTDQCVQHLQDGTCAPDSWLFWDGVHPTTAGHAILGTRFAATLDVPEPASLWLMALVLVLLGLSWRAQQRRAGAQPAWLPKPMPATA